MDAVIRLTEPARESPNEPLDMDAMHQYNRLCQQKVEQTAALKRTQEDLDNIERRVTNMMLTVGMDAVKVGGRTIYLTTEIYVSPTGDKADLIDAMKMCAAESMVAETYNPQTLRSYVREIANQVREQCVNDGVLFDDRLVVAALPVELRQHLKVGFGKTVGSRKA